MEEIQQLAVGVIFLLELSEKLWLRYSPLSDYRVKTILYVFPPLFIVKAVSVRLLEIINRHNNFKWS